MTYQELMDGVSKAFGLEKLVPDEDGLCMLIGEDVFVMFQHVPETGMVMTSSVARHFETEPTLEEMREVLEANLMWQRTRGATLSWDASAMNVMLARYDRLSTLDVDYFVNAVTDFVATLYEWGEGNLSLPSEDDEDASSADEPSADEPSADEPSADEPSADEPPADEPPSEDKPVESDGLLPVGPGLIRI